MKHTSRAVAVTALTAVALATAAGTASADQIQPTPDTSQQPADSDRVSVEIVPGLQFIGALSDNSASLVTPIGSLVMQGGRIDLQDNASHTVFGTPLDTAADPTTQDAVPAATTDAATPARVDEARTVAVDAAAPAPANPLVDLNQAWNEARPYSNLAMGITTTAGSVIGAAIGCPLGVVTGGTLGTIVSAGTLTIPVAIASCLAGAAIVGAFGMLLGTAASLPVAAAVTADKYNKIQAQRAAGITPTAPTT